MAKTGIKIKRCNVGSVEAHNERSKEYLEGLAKAGKNIYFFPELTQGNASWVNPRYEGKSCQDIFDELKSIYRDKVGQEPQLQDRTRTNKKTGKEYTVAGWSPIREGCPPIKEDTKVEDFFPMVEWARKNGLDVIRIDLHFDEGHDDAKTKERKLNRHAHVVFDWVDHSTGKTIKLDDAKMSELQDILASSLSMERGEKKSKTGKQHIPHAEYREMKAAENAEAMETEAEEAKQERDRAIEERNEVQSQTESLRKENNALVLRREYLTEELEGLSSSIQAKTEGIAKGTAQAIANIGRGIGQGLGDMFAYALPSKARDKVDKKEKERQEALKAKRKAESDAETAKREQRKAERDRDNAIRDKDNFISRYKSEIANIDRKNIQINNMAKERDDIKGLMEDAASIGLTAQQTWSLYKGHEVEMPSIVLAEHQDIPITTKDGTPWRLRFMERLQIAHKNMWKPVSTWVKDARKGVMEWLRRQDNPRMGKGRGL